MNGLFYSIWPRLSSDLVGSGISALEMEYCHYCSLTAYLSLSLLPLQSSHLKTDLINIGHYKNLNTIGKQNYQEPGVEAELNFEFFESFHFIF